MSKNQIISFVLQGNNETQILLTEVFPQAKSHMIAPEWIDFPEVSALYHTPPGTAPVAVACNPPIPALMLEFDARQQYTGHHVLGVSGAGDYLVFTSAAYLLMVGAEVMNKSVLQDIQSFEKHIPGIQTSASVGDNSHSEDLMTVQSYGDLYHPNHVFESSPSLRVVFSTLVINGRVLEERYPGGLEALFAAVPQWGVTNGYLVTFSEMMGYPAELYDLADTHLLPYGLEEGRDFVIGEDETLMGIRGEMDEPHALEWCSGLPWLRSWVSLEGNQVWHTELEKDLTHCREDYWKFWYLLHPVLKHYRLKKIDADYHGLEPDALFYDVVDEGTFAAHEEGRLPMFIATEFEVFPHPEKVLPPDYRGPVALLTRSVLTGEVAGLLVKEMEQSSYATTYYDTSFNEMFVAHHNGKLNRYKIRKRSYVSSGISFLEIKFKNNKGRTIKKRIPTNYEDHQFTDKEADFIQHNTPYLVKHLKTTLLNNFSRVTLVNKNFTAYPFRSS